MNDVADPDEASAAAVRMLAAEFGPRSVGRVATMVRRAGIDAGIPARDIEDLLIAVSEVVTSAIRHAGGAGTITLTLESDGLLTEIRDNGPGLRAGVLSAQPSSGAGHGGLWLAQVLSSGLDIIDSPHGLTVRIFTPSRTASGGQLTAMTRVR